MAVMIVHIKLQCEPLQTCIATECVMTPLVILCFHHFLPFLFPLNLGNINPFNASCSKLLLLEGFSTILV